MAVNQSHNVKKKRFMPPLKSSKRPSRIQEMQESNSVLLQKSTASVNSQQDFCTHTLLSYCDSNTYSEFTKLSSYPSDKSSNDSIEQVTLSDADIKEWLVPLDNEATISPPRRRFKITALDRGKQTFSLTPNGIKHSKKAHYVQRNDYRSSRDKQEDGTGKVFEFPDSQHVSTSKDVDFHAKATDTFKENMAKKQFDTEVLETISKIRRGIGVIRERYDYLKNTVTLECSSKSTKSSKYLTIYGQCPIEE